MNSLGNFFESIKKSTLALARDDDKSSDNESNQAEEQTDSWFREADLDPFCPKLSKTQRVIGFMTCAGLGALCMALAWLYLPLILLKSRKFVLLFSLGSLFFIASFSILWGVRNHMKHLFSTPRLPFTMSYFTTLFATIYYAMIIKSVLFTIVFAFLQVSCLAWYVLNYLPGRQQGLRIMTKLFYKITSRSIQSTFQV